MQGGKLKQAGSALGVRLTKDDKAGLGPLESHSIRDGIIVDDGFSVDASHVMFDERKFDQRL